MDPFSIATGCVGLASAVTKVSIVLGTFVRDVRESRSDVDSVARELLSLKTVLELLADDVGRLNVPPNLAEQISGVICHCTDVIRDLERCIERYNETKVKGKLTWATTGKGDMARLRSALEAHKSTLGISLDMLSLTSMRELQQTTTSVDQNTSAILNQTGDIEDKVELLLQVVTDIQVRLPMGENPMLRRYLEQLSNYAESVVDEMSTVDDRSDRASCSSGGTILATGLSTDPWPGNQRTKEDAVVQETLELTTGSQQPKPNMPREPLNSRFRAWASRTKATTSTFVSSTSRKSDDSPGLASKKLFGRKWLRFPNAFPGSTLAAESTECEEAGVFGTSLRESYRVARCTLSLKSIEPGVSETSSLANGDFVGGIPLVVAMCGVFLKEEGDYAKDIFVRPVDPDSIAKLRQEFSTPPFYGSDYRWEEHGFGIHEAAAVLLLYLSELKDPILPLSKIPVDTLLQAPNSPSDFYQILKPLISRLLPLHRLLLFYVIDVAAFFYFDREINGFDEDRLCEVFAQRIFKPSPSEFATREKDMHGILMALVEGANEPEPPPI
ncbi:uncharacterized protein MKZ38_002354 [Zalerion maritima]|uniref:Rho-GAP domain-containing protein n=1 Tax=Zalerion maritima TaxID=339359 RepID=A0AAD5RX84_9PEZI|nr:uncharacterized protein MKZ38_002354 [Zalerion maritima]